MAGLGTDTKAQPYGHEHGLPLVSRVGGGVMAGGEVGSGILCSVNSSPQDSWIVPCENYKTSYIVWPSPSALQNKLHREVSTSQRGEHFTPGLSRKSNLSISSKSPLSQENHTTGRDGTSCFVRNSCPNLVLQGNRMAGPLPQREGCQAVIA